MMYVEGVMKCRSTTTGSMEESSSKGKLIESNVEGGKTRRTKLNQKEMKALTIEVSSRNLRCRFLAA